MTALKNQDSKTPNLLIAEDDEGFRETLALEFRELGFSVRTVMSLFEFENLEEEDFDYAVVDLKLGNDNGLRIIDGLKKSSTTCRIVVLTGYGSVATAVQATKLGAADYLMKPASISRILAALTESNDQQDYPALEAQPLSLAKAEREYIESVIAGCQGNISRAASLLGLHRQSLQRKLRKFSPLK